MFGAKYVDREVGKQLCEAMTPVALGAAERAFELEHKERKQEVEQAQLRVQAAQYAADRAFEQYDLADPKNRLVVDNLERAFRAHHRIQQRKPASDSDILTGLQAREHLGVGYNGLMALVRSGAVHTNQVTDFAPYQISRAELDSEPVQSLVRALKSTGRLPPEGGCPRQQPLFSTKSTKL